MLIKNFCNKIAGIAVILFVQHINAHAAGPTLDELQKEVSYFRRHVFPMLEKLRRGEEVTHEALLKLYIRDPFLDKRRHAGGHDTFVHKYLPKTFGIVGRNGNEQIDRRMRAEILKDIQVFVDVIFNGVLHRRRDVDQAALKKFRNLIIPKEYKLKEVIESKRYDHLHR